MPVRWFNDFNAKTKWESDHGKLRQNNRLYYSEIGRVNQGFTKENHSAESKTKTRNGY